MEAAKGGCVGYCVQSNCTFRQAVSFPDVLHVGLSVVKVTTSSVFYNVAVFKRERSDACAYGRFVHVFVNTAVKPPKVSENTGRNPTTVSQILGEYKGEGVYCDINMGAIRRGN